MALFAAIIEFMDDVEHRLEVRPIHREYLAKLMSDGKLHESGPFTDDSGALLIYDAADESEVQSMLAADPYTSAGIIRSSTIRGWNVVMSKYAG